ncbi:sigma-70 family RNA polymerase sigma factor [Thermospira aquatica]|uniref:Sigma-70 family RNA polymerase sigma factor n=1 Tax=Thermospira aquatica TaxID=2828656 RepID=A0AAX3BBP3_9SPIR|nr:sigma-70 family RNA polymerase sigma factor [Thermospira aquatica]URA09702.1 sigma-70 family RNA polymerase sigma factor [Thermospira aquatica]
MQFFSDKEATTRQFFYSSLTDEELLTLVSKDKSAEKEFYHRYRYRILRWIAPFHFWDKDDLFQEALIALYEAMKTYDPDRHTGFKTYANTCIRNRIVSYMRKFSTMVDYVDPEVMSEIPGEGSLKGVEEKLFFEEFLHTLSSLEQKILVKRFIERKSYVDIAAELAISPKKVDNILYKIRHELEKYQKQEDDHEA